MRRLAYWLAVVLLLVATIVVSVAVSGGHEREGATSATTPTSAATTPADDAASGAAAAAPLALVLVRRRGGLPPRWVARLRRSDAIAALTRVGRAQRLLRGSTTGGGKVVDRPRAGYAIPLDALVVHARGYTRMVRREDRAAVRGLRSGRVLLSASSAKLRGLGTGARLTLSTGRTVRVAGVVSDDTARDAEIVLPAIDAPDADPRSAQVLVAAKDAESVDRLVPDDRLTVVAPLLSGAATRRASIVRSVQIKQRFGEFAVRLPYGDDWIEIDPAWRARALVTRTVPILGRVTCHRAMIAPLRDALAEVRRRGLARLVDRADYAGCYAPRRIPGAGSLSLHAWGLAIDLNASRNPQGAAPEQDPRLVAAFERAGFTWGGRWPTAPDGMHFELHDRAT